MKISLSTMSEGEKFRKFLDALDNAPIEISDFEANFLESNYGRITFSPKQRNVILNLIQKYGHRIQNANH